MDLESLQGEACLKISIEGSKRCLFPTDEYSAITALYQYESSRVLK